MTKNADFKKRVRARMAKTGERYAAARAQLLDAPPPTVDEYADLAGMSDEAVAAKTDRTWPQWVAALDALGAADLDHRAIAAAVGEHWPEIGGWWAQTVTVGYERIRGLREKGQKSTGTWSANKSKTFKVPVDRLFAAFDTPDQRARWLDEAVAVRTSTPPRSLRWTWPDGTVVSAWFTDKGERSSVAIQHDQLADADAREAAKAAWAARLGALDEALR